MNRVAPTSVLALVLAAATLAPGTALAQSQGSPPDESLFGDNADRGSGDQAWHASGRLTLEGAFLSETDLDPATALDEEARIQPEARIDLTWTPDKDVEVGISVEAGHDLDRRDGSWNGIERLEVRELYLLVDDFLMKDFQLQVGRQDVEDGREWLYDAKLDGVRVAYDHRAWRIEAMWGREQLVSANLLHPRPDRRKVDAWLFHAEYEVTRDWDVAAYVIKQNDLRASNISPLTYGIQSEGRSGALGHWLELALQQGESGSRRLDAWAIDAGLIWYLPLPARPALFAGYARASGGGDAITDRSFRQTGLQDNEDRITGLGNVRYYGEALDPDLSNLEVWTLGLGLRPTRTSSLEVIAHRYRQSVADDNDLRGSPVAAIMNGTSRDVGTEIDIAVSTRLWRRTALEAKLGWFSPGQGFGNNRADAVLGKVRFVMRF